MCPMETLYLGYETAQWYWLNARNGAKTVRQRPARQKLIDATQSRRAIRQIVKNTLFQDQILHAVSSKPGYRDDEHIVMHCISTPLPHAAFVRLSKQIFIASPELSFLQAATYLSFPQLVHFGYALCGMYALNPMEASGTSPREPLTTHKKIHAFLERTHHLQGSVLARRSLKYVLENSRSPRESTVAMILSLPLRYGGRGLPAPQLNKRIPIPDHLKNQTDRSHFEVDFFWEKEHVAAEYDSDAVHQGKEKRCSDAIKSNVLPALGYSPFAFTRPQVNNPYEMDKTVERLRILLRVKARKRLPLDYQQKKMSLRHELGLPVNRWSCQQTAGADSQP